jgi:IS605 OrfB family transposase
VFIGKASDKITDIGKKRNKLFYINKKAVAKGDKAKEKKVHRFNLGLGKSIKTTRRRRAEMKRQINMAINKVIAKRKPKVIVTEKLDIRGKGKSKVINRRVSLWARKKIKERIEFKASAEGFRREQVNPAYSSQTCPPCGFVHKDNRQGDRFQCLYCGDANGNCDWVAAINLLARLADPDIHLYTPKERVKAILLERFNARWERENPTVSGRTPDTPSVGGQSESETTGVIWGEGENTGARCSQA